MKKKIVLIIIIIVIVIALIASGVYFFMTHNNSSKNENVDVDINEEEQTNLSLIDMNNTENVEITGDVKENNSAALLEEKELLGLKVTNIRLAAEEGMTHFTADVENISNQDFKERDIVIVFKNKDGSEFNRLPGHLPDIPVGDSNRIDASIIDDLSNAYDFIIE